MSEGYESILFEVDGGVARLTLNRPDRLNAWAPDMNPELLDALARAADEEAVRVVLISGAGRAFCSGADISSDRSVNSDGEVSIERNLKEGYNPVILAVRELPKPIVAAVRGPAAGVGCSLALACDLVLCAESSYFLLAFVNIGLTLDGGASAFIPARAGAARAAEMGMLGERIEASQALEWGLCNRVIADDELDDAASELAERLAAGPTRSYAATKRLLNNHLYPRLREQLDLEAETQQEQSQTEDFVAGVVAFASKQPAEFKGR